MCLELQQTRRFSRLRPPFFVNDFPPTKLILDDIVAGLVVVWKQDVNKHLVSAVFYEEPC